MCVSSCVWTKCVWRVASPLTLNLCNGAGKDVLLNLGVLKVSHDLVDDGADELGLLRLASLGFVADPRVEGGLDLGGDGSLLLESKGLVFKLGSLLCNVCGAWLVFEGKKGGKGQIRGVRIWGRTRLGHGEKSLGDLNRVLHL